MDSMRPLVSVILPVHDGAGFLPGALSVIRIQDYRPLQIIVVDDGSRDETARIAERSSDVLVLRLERNRGPAAARNAGLSRAEGEFVAFLDVDDHWPPGTLLHQDERLVTDPAADVETETLAGG